MATDVANHPIREHALTHGDEDCRGPDAALPHHARVDRCGFRSPELDADEDEEAHAEDDEEGDDAAAGPQVDGAAPLQGDEEADDSREEEGGAEDVELREALSPGERAVHRVFAAVGDGVEEEEDEASATPPMGRLMYKHQRHVTFAVKAPPTSCMINPVVG